MSLTSLGLKRTLLTTARLRPATPLPQQTIRLQKPYQPILSTSPRYFSATMGKEGVHNLKSSSEFNEAVEADKLMVLDCFATWCGPCKIIAPKVAEFSDKYPEARFYKLDVDEVPDVAEQLSVRAMPTFMLFKGGEKVSEVVGANPAALEAAIKANI